MPDNPDDDRTSSIGDRVASLSDEGDDDESVDEQPQRAAGPGQSVMSALDEHLPDPEPVEGSLKDEYNEQRIYLPDELEADLKDEFRRLQYEYSRENPGELQKNRDFYPAVLALGLAYLEDGPVFDRARETNTADTDTDADSE